MTDEQVISFIKRLVIEQGKTIDEIAAHTKVSVRTINNIMRKKHSISLIVREKIELYSKKLSSLS